MTHSTEHILHKHSHQLFTLILKKEGNIDKCLHSNVFMIMTFNRLKLRIKVRKTILNQFKIFIKYVLKPAPMRWQTSF